jgi:diguanylate cyclase (GGDEF)-like protein/PAS domain S-box-containing protein
MSVQRIAGNWQSIRPLVLFCGLSLLILCASVAVGARALIASFQQVEAAATAQKALQVYRAFEADLRQLAISNRDYAEWDDAVDFVQTGNPRFISTNFIPDALNVMHVDMVCIVDRDGRELFSGVASRAGAAMVSPAPPEYLREARQFLGNDGSAARLSPIERIVTTPHGLEAVSVLEIKRTDRSGPTGALMLFARFIEDADIQRLRDTTQLPVAMIDLRATASAFEALPAPVKAWIDSRGDTASTFVLADGDSHIGGYALVRDSKHVPVALFASRTTRDIYGLGYRTTWLMLTGVVAMFIAFGAAVLWLIVTLQRSFAARHSVETRYRNIAAQLRESIVLVDARSLEIIEANDAARRALGCERDSLQSRSVQDLFPDITPALLSGATLRTRDRTIVESRARCGNGRWVDAEVTIASLEIHGRRLLTLMGYDVGHRKEAERRELNNRRKLVQLAEHDSLTGLPNRLYLNTKLPKVLGKVTNADQLLALIYVDVDHFKNINDSRGHGCGDRLLQTVAARMGAAVSVQDVVARMGGDEFVIVAPLIPDMAAIEALAARLQTAVSGPIVLEDGPVTVTASLGIAVYPRDGLDAKTLLKHADIALYQAKDAGRNCHRFFAADMDVRVCEHVALEQALRHAVGSDQIFMVYQPVIDLRTGEIASLEALMRWREPERGMIPPNQFIPVAEKSGLIVELGRYAFTQVVKQARAWLDAGVPMVPIAVNVSSIQLDRMDFAALVAELSAKAGVDPHWLRFEITESALMKEPDKLIGTLQTLRALGAQVLIDDFGTGYSSLSYLNRLPVDTLKIDRAFIQDLGKETAPAPILNAMIEMARKLGLQTVAEGVESEAQAMILRAQGCDFAQGYYFSKAVSAAHCQSLLLHTRRRFRPFTEEPMRACAVAGA